MDPTVGPVTLWVLAFVTFVVPFIAIAMDDRAWHGH
jgi:hypothetical protein